MHEGKLLWLWGFLPLFAACAAAWVRPLLTMKKGKGRSASSGQKAPGTLSPGQAAGAALAATIGTGNIVGTAQAIAMGGPGAVFWMWAAALLAMPVKAAEILMGQRMGGAMGYIRRALGPFPAKSYTLLALGNVLILGNMTQMNTASSLFGNVDFPAADLAVPLMLTALIAICLQKGIDGVGRLCMKLIFVMAGLYLAACAAGLFMHARRISPAFRLIFRCALHPRAAGGAASGLLAREACLWGLKRGAFSNEAGLGTAANIHAYTGETDPVRNALLGAAEVFADTLLCTLTALVLLTAAVPIPDGSLPGSELAGQALAESFGKRASVWLLALCLGSFALSTVLGSYIVGHRCADSLGIGVRVYRSVFLGCSALGSLLPLRWIWLSADTVNVLMALPNLLALLLLSGGERGEEGRISRKLKNLLLPRRKEWCKIAKR